MYLSVLTIFIVMSPLPLLVPVHVPVTLFVLMREEVWIVVPGGHVQVLTTTH